VKNRLLILSDDTEIERQIQKINEKHAINFSITVSTLLVDVHTVVKVAGSYPIVLIDLDSIDDPIQQKIVSLMERNRFHQGTIILLKSNPTANEVRSFLKNGAFDILTKPLTIDSVHCLLQELRVGSIKHNQPATAHLDERTISYLKSSLAYDLVFGSVKNAKEIWDRCRLIGLSVVPNTAMVVHIDDFYKNVENKSKQWEQSIRQEVIESVQSYLKETMQETLVIITNTDKIAVLLATRLKNNQVEYKITAKELAVEIQEYVHKNTGYTITIGIGNYYEDARNLHVSYQEAFHAQENKFFIGKNTVIHIGDIEPFRNEAKVILNYDILPLANKVTVGDFVGVKTELISLENMLFSQRNINPQVFNLQIIDILTSIARAAIHGGAKPKDVFYIHHQYSLELKSLETIQEIKQWFGEVIENMLEQVLSSHNEQTLWSVQKAIKYIDQHFDQHITLEEISYYVSLSANYFSNMFKKTTGQSFIEYVSRLRIEKSKELLMDLNYTVYQIANAVGYSDARYFSRVFKTVVGKTPTQYRNSIIGTKFAKEDV
jgi:AraC-like DNA-binding protein